MPKAASTIAAAPTNCTGSASRSQLYHHFEDRDDLVRAVVALRAAAR
jgi:hypothetical protein